MDVTISQFSFRDVLHARKRIGHIDRMLELAITLGYPYFLWNDRVYKVGEAGYIDTRRTISDVL